jgi:methionyl-tRNA formyltransferase
MDSLRLVFFGTPDFALPTLEALLASPHQVVGVVTQPDRPRGRGQQVTHAPVKRLALERGLAVLQPDRLRDEAFLETLRSLAADCGVVAAYGKILPGAVLAAPRLGLLNVHASLLPKYRGAAPVPRAVMEGERETGVTIMRVVKALDAGPLLAASTRPIGPDETSTEVEHDLAQLGARLLVRVLASLGSVPEIPQDDRLATYAPRLERDEGAIDWHAPAREIHNQVRGLHPWPHAFTFLDDARYIVHRTVVDASAPTAESPGTVLEASGDRLVVATGAGTVGVVSIQAEGRRPVSAREFLAGHRLQPGARFESHASP